MQQQLICALIGTGGTGLMQTSQHNLYRLLNWYYFYLFIFPVEKILNIFIDYAITVVPFPPLHSTHPAHLLPPTFPPYSSCPWVIHISSLASTFPTLFLPSSCLFSTYHLCYLFSVPSPLTSPPTPLLITLHVISISVVLFLFQLFLSLLLFLFQVWLLITVSLLSFLLFIFLIFFFLDKSL